MNIVLVDDEKIFSEKVAKKLKSLWFNVLVFNDINSLANSSTGKIDLYIIDLFLGDWLGFELFEKIKQIKEEKTPVIMISWLDNSDNKILWLNLWADDFLVKPFTPEELIARIKAVIRRTNNYSNSEKELKYKDIFYDVWKNIFFKNSLQINLTWKQKQLTAYFILNIWKVITKTSLIVDIWWEYNSDFITSNTINATICKLRKKLWDEFKLETIHSEGYILKD